MKITQFGTETQHHPLLPVSIRVLEICFTQQEVDGDTPKDANGKERKKERMALLNPRLLTDAAAFLYCQSRGNQQEEKSDTEARCMSHVIRFKKIFDFLLTEPVN